ncbi:hypothetical protein Taro_051933 [Colocasia esculenta]|uniref:Pentatricopeptide repeat-containing protein n=1 Tax=Colocasia esculenta TaxID=4460 RepID=A0A843XHW4_COLES|nr:hypothetical protein [Colocasia esculenta]
MLLSQTLPRGSRLLASNPFSTLPASFQWRDRIHRRRLVAHVASILLQRKQWAPLLLDRRPALLAGFSANPGLLLQVLARTASHPLIALDFFRWSETALGIHPDLRSRCKMVQILVDSGNPAPAKSVLEPALRSLPAPAVLDEVARICRCGESRSAVLGLLLLEYALSGRVLDGLEAFRRIRASGFPPTSRECNALLDGLISSGEIRMARCFHAAAVRAGVVADPRTVLLVARLLCKEGKLERALGLAESSVSYAKVCHLVVDFYSGSGDFAAAVNLLKNTCEKSLRPGFGVYSSILDGGCKFKNAAIVSSTLRDMFVRRLLSNSPFFDYDSVIQRLCELEKTYAAELFLERAWHLKANLDTGTYVCLLRALSKAGRVKEAMRMYGIMLEKGVTVNPRCLDVFLRAVCTGEPSDVGTRVLKDVIGKGFILSALDISEYIAKQCCKGWWQDADDILNLVLQKGILPDANCCASLVHHYCASNLIDLAITLLKNLQKLGGGFDVTSYNQLLDSLARERRLNEAIQVFDYMREQNVRDRTSFIIIITALCQGKELRKAMNLHDEMLKVGLKPEEDAYKVLISGDLSPRDDPKSTVRMKALALYISICRVSVAYLFIWSGAWICLERQVHLQRKPVEFSKANSTMSMIHVPDLNSFPWRAGAYANNFSLQEQSKKGTSLLPSGYNNPTINNPVPKLQIPHGGTTPTQEKENPQEVTTLCLENTSMEHQGKEMFMDA